jgi:hypothetical protein
VLTSDLPGVNPATLNEMILYYHLMTQWSGLGDSTELSRMGLSQSHSLGIVLCVCRIGLGVRARVCRIHEGRVALLRSRMPVVKIEDEDEALATATQDFYLSLNPRGLY